MNFAKLLFSANKIPALITIHGFIMPHITCTMSKVVAAVDITVLEESVSVCFPKVHSSSFSDITFTFSNMSQLPRVPLMPRTKLLCLSRELVW